MADVRGPTRATHNDAHGVEGRGPAVDRRAPPAARMACAEGGNPERFGARMILGTAARLQDGASLASGAIAAAIAPLARRACRNATAGKIEG